MFQPHLVFFKALKGLLMQWPPASNLMSIHQTTHANSQLYYGCHTWILNFDTIRVWKKWHSKPLSMPWKTDKTCAIEKVYKYLYFRQPYPVYHQKQAPKWFFSMQKSRGSRFCWTANSHQLIRFFDHDQQLVAWSTGLRFHPPVWEILNDTHHSSNYPEEDNKTVYLVAMVNLVN